MTSRRFRFKLEPLRTIREHAELAAMKELAHELAIAAELGEELAGAGTRLEAAHAATAGGSATAAELTVRQAFVERRERELESAQIQVRLQEGHVQAQRSRLEAAMREREVLDRLKERRRSAHDSHARRAERDAADEISLAMRSASLGGAA